LKVAQVETKIIFLKKISRLIHKSINVPGIEKSIREKWTKLKEGIDSSKKGSHLYLSK
jgi:hypothetical protein